MDPTIAASIISAGAGFGAGALSSAGSGLFGINQARKNRAFQERMYKKQVEDNIRFWNMTNEYNLPSAQVERLRNANLSPMLMYGEGGISGNLANGTPDSATAPHGDKAQANIGAEFNLANTELIKAQIENLRAERDLKEANAQESKSRTENYDYDVMFKRLSKDIDLAIKHGSLDQLFAATDNLRQQIYSSGQLTLQTTLSMIQAREYEVKRFNLDADTIGEQLQQRWKEIANGTIAANAQMRSAMAATMTAAANWRLSNAQVGQIALNMSQSKEMFPLLKGYQTELNWSQVQDRIFKGVQISNAQKEGFLKELDNRLKFSGFGTDTYLYKFAAPWVLPMVRDGKSMSNTYYKSW